MWLYVTMLTMMVSSVNEWLRAFLRHIPVSSSLSFSLCAQIGSLQMKIVQEDKVVEQKTVELMQEWERSKPVQVNVLPLSLSVGR